MLDPLGTVTTGAMNRFKNHQTESVEVFSAIPTDLLDKNNRFIALPNFFSSANASAHLVGLIDTMAPLFSEQEATANVQHDRMVGSSLIALLHIVLH